MSSSSGVTSPLRVTGRRSVSMEQIIGSRRRLGEFFATYVQQRSIMRARGTHKDTATLTSDSGTVFSVTLVNIAPFGDHSEHFCCSVMSQMVKADQISLDTGDPIKVISHFGVREPASEWHASRYVRSVRCSVSMTALRRLL